MCELKSQHTGVKTFPPPPAHLRDNIQPIDIPHTHGLPIRSNLSHLDVMLKVHGIRSLELTPLPLPEQVKRTPMKSHMASVPQTSSMKRSRDTATHQKIVQLMLTRLIYFYTTQRLMSKYWRLMRFTKGNKKFGKGPIQKP